jgi:hypothetical protein
MPATSRGAREHSTCAFRRSGGIIAMLPSGGDAVCQKLSKACKKNVNRIASPDMDFPVIRHRGIVWWSRDSCGQNAAGSSFPSERLSYFRRLHRSLSVGHYTHGGSSHVRIWREYLYTGTAPIFSRAIPERQRFTPTTGGERFFYSEGKLTT